MRDTEFSDEYAIIEDVVSHEPHSCTYLLKLLLPFYARADSMCVIAMVQRGKAQVERGVGFETCGWNSKLQFLTTTEAR